MFNDDTVRRLAQCTRHLTITMQPVHRFRHRGRVSWRHDDAALTLTENVGNPTDGARDRHRARRHAFQQGIRQALCVIGREDEHVGLLQDALLVGAVLRPRNLYAILDSRVNNRATQFLESGPARQC